MVATKNAPEVDTTPEINLNLRMGVGDLVQELKRRMESRVDVIADTRQMEILVRDGRFYLAANPGTALTEWMVSGPNGGMEVETQAIGQVLERCDVSVPKQFGERLAAKHPEWAAELVTNLLRASGTTRMVRMMDNRVRAFLSNAYRCLDNYDMAATALQVAQTVGAEVVECHLTPTRMELKLVNRNVWESVDATQRDAGGGYAAWANHKWIGHVGFNGGGELPGGPGTIHPLISVGNSETGHGGYFVSVGILQAICCNGAIVRRELGQVHLGAKQTLEGVLQQDTLRAEAKAIHLKARDIITAGFDAAKFKQLAGLMEKANAVTIANPKPVLDFCVENAIFTESQRDDIFAHFVRDYKPTVLGLASAMTRAAQDYDDADVSSELENAAGDLIANPKKLAAVGAA